MWSLRTKIAPSLNDLKVQPWGTAHQPLLLISPLPPMSDHEVEKRSSLSDQEVEKRPSNELYETETDVPSYEEAAVNIGAPVEKISPLGYHVDSLSVVFLVGILRLRP